MSRRLAAGDVDRRDGGAEPGDGVHDRAHGSILRRVPGDSRSGDAALFMRGAFTPRRRRHRRAALAAYGVGLPAVVLIRSAVASFYARQDTATPLIASFAGIGVNVLLKLMLFRRWARRASRWRRPSGAWVNVRAARAPRDAAGLDETRCGADADAGRGGSRRPCTGRVGADRGAVRRPLGVSLPTLRTEAHLAVLGAAGHAGLFRRAVRPAHCFKGTLAPGLTGRTRQRMAPGLSGRHGPFADDAAEPASRSPAARRTALAGAAVHEIAFGRHVHRLAAGEMRDPELVGPVIRDHRRAATPVFTGVADVVVGRAPAGQHRRDRHRRHEGGEADCSPGASVGRSGRLSRSSWCAGPGFRRMLRQHG